MRVKLQNIKDTEKNSKSPEKRDLLTKKMTIRVTTNFSSLVMEAGRDKKKKSLQSTEGKKLLTKDSIIS